MNRSWPALEAMCPNSAPCLICFHHSDLVQRAFALTVPSAWNTLPLCSLDGLLVIHISVLLLLRKKGPALPLL